MGGAVVIAALAFMLLMVGGFPLLLLALGLFFVWFVWSIFRKEPDEPSNGWCRELQREIEANRRHQI